MPASTVVATEDTTLTISFKMHDIDDNEMSVLIEDGLDNDSTIECVIAEGEVKEELELELNHVGNECLCTPISDSDDSFDL